MHHLPSVYPREMLLLASNLPEYFEAEMSFAARGYKPSRMVHCWFWT